MNKKSLCKRSFRQAGNLDVEDRADGVKNGVYSNASTFTTPPITQVALAALITTYATTRKAHDQGGTAQLPAFTAARKAVIAALDSIANYVDTVAAGNSEIIKLSGFEATNDPNVNTNVKTISGTGNPATPQNITFKRIENQSGQMIAECELYTGSSYRYIAFLVENNPLPAGVAVDDNGSITIPSGLTISVVINANNQRKKVFTGLHTGSTYYVYYVVINSKGASGISNGKAMLCG